MTLPSPAPILDLIDAFRRSKTMFAAAELGIFDRLQSGPAPAAALAAALGAAPEALARLLDACVGLGLLRRTAAGYALEPVSAAYLCRSSPDSLAGYILYSNAALYALWGRLEDAVREGSHRWKQVFGTDGPLFAHFFRSDAALADFVAGMHGFGLLSSPAVVAAADLAPFSRMVDLGGATGHLARAALERYPGLRAVVFDLPEVVARVRGQAPPLDGRLEFVAGDFFRDALPSADLYALGRIVHDWGEERVGDLLARVHAALPPGGGLLLAERLLADDRSGPLPAQLQSLNMLVCTEGKERTEREYRALLEASGFTDVTCHRTGTPLDAIFAVKPPA